MDEFSLNFQKITFKRMSTLKDNDPACSLCAKANPWANYHHHHVDLRKFSDDQILVCQDCHQEIHAMLNSFPRIPATVPASRRKLIQVVRGQLVMLDLSKRKLEEVHAYLLGDINLPPDPIPTAANDNRLPTTGGEIAEAAAISDQSTTLKGEVQ